ncbi:hypothetical protein [Pelagerythrobacter sp.]|uniref:hypothetical protein n=1 Tax=Pelagerythrobacter sp. TaxID=2800702 RepID=UPI0035B2274E
MPYDPQAPTGGETASAFNMAWTGLAANVVLLISYLTGSHTISTAALAVTGALIAVVMFSNRFDEHFSAVRDTGLRWGMSVIALYLFAGAVLSLATGVRRLGFYTAAGEWPDLGRGIPGLLADGYLLAIVAGLAFHLGFAWARIRGAASR